MRVRNFTNIKKREKRIYTFYDVTISQQGLVVDTLQVIGFMLLIFNIIGVIFSIAMRTNYYSVFRLLDYPKSSAAFYFFFIIFPIVLGSWMSTYKIQNYKVVDYLKIVITPKIPLDSNGKKLSDKGYETDALVERLK